jgi:hypothetical protein
MILGTHALPQGLILQRYVRKVLSNSLEVEDAGAVALLLYLDLNVPDLKKQKGWQHGQHQSQRQ